ncbi:hypothetical protein WJX72_007786 [[Myrmecia] bisecta]|uniref:Uncharacterized protein n=1 Tax=[Myrmecia] bisecta TaxID=41462 RepID=A0AAW1R7N7_9CHLO
MLSAGPQASCGVKASCQVPVQRCASAIRQRHPILNIPPCSHGARQRWQVITVLHGSTRQRYQRCLAAPVWNPQNVPDPKVMPCKSFSPEECIQAQLDALQHSDEPWPDHGIQTMYEFGEDIGGMERSRYFGFSKDLYHFDHFIGMRLEVVPAGNIPTASLFTWTLKRKDVGRKTGALMTASVVRAESC